MIWNNAQNMLATFKNQGVKKRYFNVKNIVLRIVLEYSKQIQDVFLV